MKRITALGLVAVLTLAALAVLAITAHRLDDRLAHWAQAEALLAAVRLADSDLDRRVLLARGGLLRNYDLLSSQQDVLRDDMAALAAATSDDPDLPAATARLQAAIDEKEARIEQFKTSNALLANSLLYFRLAADAHHTSSRAGTHDNRSVLIAAIQRLGLEASAEASASARHELELLAQSPAPLAAGDRAMLQHGRLLTQVLPQLDTLLARLHPIATEPAFLDVGNVIEARRLATTRRIALVRDLLLLLAGLLLATVLWLGRLQARRTAVLRRRKAFDGIMMGVSARLATTARADLDAEVATALTRLSAWAGTDAVWLWQRGHDGAAALWHSHAPAGPGVAPLLARIGANAGSGPRAEDAIVATLADASDRGEPRILFAVPRHAGGHARVLLGLVAAGRDAPALRASLSQLRMALGVLADAIGRRHLEDDAQRLERRLERAWRMETVGAMASGVAHNFNNIIGAIQGNAELAQHKLPSAAEPAAHLREILLACVRARDLVGSILRFGRNGPVEQTPLQVRALVEETVSMLQASFGGTLEILVHDHAPGARVAGNPADLQQVLMNIVTNAGLALDWTGTITITITIDSPASATASAAHGGRRLRISIADPGPGIAPEVIDRVFEPFFTTRSGGTGLGLATARQIVLDHGGDIGVESSPGDGTRFHVWLPLQDVVAAPAQDPMAPGGTILVVGRDAATVSRDEDLLAALGCEPVGIVEADAASRLASRDPCRFDAALIDLTSREDALACARELHRRLQGAPLILAHAAGALDPERLAGCGIVDVVSQPPSAAELARAVQRCRDLWTARARGSVTA